VAERTSSKQETQCRFIGNGQLPLADLLDVAESLKVVK